MKTVKVTISAPSFYGTPDEQVNQKLDEIRNQLANHLWAVGIHDNQLDGGDITKYGRDVEVICDDKAAMRLILAMGMHEHGKLGIKSVTEMFDTEETSYDRMLEKLELTAARMTEAANHLDLDYQNHVRSSDKFNAFTNSHLTGNTLSSYNSLRLMENCCTDELQGALDEGWRIISCCPQESRRPDYILGRYNPHHNAELGNGAAR